MCISLYTKQPVQVVLKRYMKVKKTNHKRCLLMSSKGEVKHLQSSGLGS